MGDFTEKKSLHFMGGYGILKDVVEEIGVKLLLSGGKWRERDDRHL